MRDVDKAFRSMTLSRINQISYAVLRRDPKKVHPPLKSKEDWLVYNRLVENYERDKKAGLKLVYETPFD